MNFFSFKYPREYAQKYSKLADLGYGKYTGYNSISPLIELLIDDNFNGITYWDKIRGTKFSDNLLRKFTDSIDYLELKKLLTHGNYITEFATQYFKKKIQQKNLNDPNSFTEFLEMSNSANYFNLDQKNKFAHLIGDITGLYMLEILNHEDKRIIKEVVDDFINKERVCPICGNRYRVIFFPEWVLKRMNGYKHLCYECPSEIPPKNETPKIVKEMVEFLGFIPNSGFQIFNDDSFSSLVNEEKWVTAFSYILKLGGSLGGRDIIKVQYGSWFKALVKADVLENGQIKTKRGVKCIANSGNECNSMSELYIDNYLYSKKLKSIKEPKYPIHNELNPKGLLRADWLVNGIYIEYFGLEGEINYDIKTQRKIMLCSELGLNLIAIFPEDLGKLDLLLNEL